MGQIFSCKGCVPPTRHATCHSTCEKYIKEKEAYDKEQAEFKKIRDNENLLNGYFHSRDIKLRKRGIVGYCNNI